MRSSFVTRHLPAIAGIVVAVVTMIVVLVAELPISVVAAPWIVMQPMDALIERMFPDPGVHGLGHFHPARWLIESATIYGVVFGFAAFLVGKAIVRARAFAEPP